jgi:hypothetical protein
MKRPLLALLAAVVTLAACDVVLTPPAPTTAPPATTTTTVAPTTTTTAKPTTTTTVAPTTTAKPTTTTLVAVQWPDATTTGVPAGTALKASGSVTVTKAGTVLDGLDITGCVSVQASDVTIRRSRIRGGSCFSVIDIQSWTGNLPKRLLVEDVEVDGQGKADNCIAFSDYTARRVDAHGCADGGKIGDNTTWDASYIHALAVTSSCHCDGLQSTDGGPTTITGTNIDVPGAGAAIMLGDEFGRLGAIVIRNSRLNGGNFELYGGANQSTGTHPSSMSVTGSVFGPSRTYGTHAYVWSGTTWSGNTDEKTGLPVNR